MHQIAQYGRLVKKKVTIENLVEKRGYTKLRWCPAPPEQKEVGWILYARSKNYSGPYEDYKEPVAASLVEEDKDYRLRGYRLLRET